MLQFIRFLLIVLPALPFLVQAATVKRLNSCNSKDIQSMSVSSCNCQGFQTGCLTPLTICNLPVNDRHTKSKVPGCTDNDWNCQGCGIWFRTLCFCLKSPTKCKHTGKIKENGPMIWVLLPEAEPLVTSTDLLPGILEMADNPQKYGGAFDFAQERYNPARQALVLNSVRVRTMEQFHIHLCYKPNPTNPKVIAILDKATLNPTTELKQIPNQDLWCMSVENGKGPLKDFEKAIHKFLTPGKKNPCRGLAGAAIIQDSNKNTWGCVTGDQHGPLPAFCAGHN